MLVEATAAYAAMPVTAAKTDAIAPRRTREWTYMCQLHSINHLVDCPLEDMLRQWRQIVMCDHLQMVTHNYVAPLPEHVFKRAAGCHQSLYSVQWPAKWIPWI